jgi:4-amino-4-deoxy-L-arabinose transferase-like glycosyltransferase
LQGTAWHMHATKEIGAPMRAYDFAGTWLAIDAFLDKRPYFFTFLISLIHDLTGFRLENAFVLNVALAALTLALAFWLGRALTSRTGPALLAMALLATLPVFGQNATGASMEMHNVAMIAVVMVCAVLYLRAPDDNRLSLLVLAMALLAQCRYESVLFVLPVGIIVALGWWRVGRVLLPWPALIAPLLLVPYVWLDRFVNSKPILWQLREGDTARFGLRYLANNLEGARIFFFNWGPGQANSLWLTVTGLAATIWALVRMVKWIRTPRANRTTWRSSHIVLCLFGIIVAANLALLMFYYWSRLDEHITARFTLPLYFILAVLTAWFVHSLETRKWPALRLAVAGLAGWFLVFGIPAHSRRLYTSLNLVMREVEWELERVSTYQQPFLLITQKATLPFVLKRIPTVNTGTAKSRGAEIAWHMRQGTFHDVFISQVVRPSSAEGDLQVDPDDVLPDAFHLQLLEQKRFGGRWIRISRVVEIEVDGNTSVGGSP